MKKEKKKKKKGRKFHTCNSEACAVASATRNL